MTEVAPEFAVVMPIGPGRLSNVAAAIDALNDQDFLPKLLVLVCDGEDAWLPDDEMFTVMPSRILRLAKHEPGMEQPRNAGVAEVDRLRAEIPNMYGDISHVWFLDSDIITQPDCLEAYRREMELGGQEGVYIGPYDWLPPGVRHVVPDLRNDPEGVPPPGRWGMFDEHEPGTRYVEQLNVGLGCFSGNLVWSIDDFIRVGGFWDAIHHGRCEDGELGLRAVAMGIPIGMAVEARGWHLWHERNGEWITATNARDVPLLNARHPWMEGRCKCGHEQHQHVEETSPVEERRFHGACVECECMCFQRVLFVVEEDGKRFNYCCPHCGDEFNTALIWTHRVHCLSEVESV